MLFLRYATIALLLLAAWGPALPLAPVRTVVLLDQSPSAKDQTFRLAQDLKLQNARYLAFASSAQVVASAAARRADLGDTTDIVEGLEAALALKPDRILLVSDGLFTSPAPAPKVPLYALLVAPSPNLSLSFSPPPYPVYGEVVELRALIDSNTRAKIRVSFSGPAGVQTQDLETSPGKTSLAYRFTLEKPAQVIAKVESPLGTREQKIEIRPVDRVRVQVLGDAALARYLAAQGFAVAESLDIGPQIQAEVVAIGVGARDLSQAGLDSLRNFLNSGGSLLWTATPKGLFFGGWERSSLADSIPLDPKEEKAGAGLVLVLDVSGSMLEGHKLDLALDGALELVRSAREQDYLGVVLFSSGPSWLFRPRPMTEQGRKEAAGLLNSVRAGGGTAVGRAYGEAVSSLAGVPAERKQILVLSDGLVQDRKESVLEAARKAAAKSIFTSSVALGQDADQSFLSELSRQGGGSFYKVPEPKDLPRFFLEEAGRAFRRNSLEGVFPLTVVNHPATQGFAPPPLSVMLPARAKPWAASLLNFQDQSVLAVGEAGSGRVAALATDLSRSWTSWKEAPGFLGSLVRWLSRTPARPRASAFRDAFGVTVVVEGRFERPILRFSGRDIPLAPVAPFRYQATLPPFSTGEAVVFESDKQRLSVILPAAPEWRAEEGKENLKRLSQASGGALLASPAELSKLPVRKQVSTRYWLLILALAAFLAERFLEWRIRGKASFSRQP